MIKVEMFPYFFETLIQQWFQVCKKTGKLKKGTFHFPNLREMDIHS